MGYHNDEDCSIVSLMERYVKKVILRKGGNSFDFEDSMQSIHLEFCQKAGSERYEKILNMKVPSLDSKQAECLGFSFKDFKESIKKCIIRPFDRLRKRSERNRCVEILRSNFDEDFSQKPPEFDVEMAQEIERRCKDCDQYSLLIISLIKKQQECGGKVCHKTNYNLLQISRATYYRKLIALREKLKGINNVYEYQRRDE